MDPRESPHVKAFEEQLKGWTDQRFVSSTQIHDLCMFSLYLVNLAEADGWEYVGHSYRESKPMGMLVVKALVDGIPHVVFCSGRGYATCIRIFLRKLEEGWLEWVPDRFA